MSSVVTVGIVVSATLVAIPSVPIQLDEFREIRMEMQFKSKKSNPREIGFVNWRRDQWWFAGSKRNVLCDLSGLNSKTGLDCGSTGGAVNICTGCFFFVCNLQILPWLFF